MGRTTESHLLCQLFFSSVIFPWEHVSAVRITVGSVRAVSYLDMKEGKMGGGGLREGDGGPLGTIVPEIHWAAS